MDLSKTILGCLIGFAAIQFAVLPLLKKRIEFDFRAGKPIKEGLIAAIEYLRKYLVTALAVFCIVWLLLLATAGAPSNPLAINALLRRIDLFGSALKPFAEWYTRALTVVCFLILATLSIRWSTADFYAKLKSEMDRLLRAQRDHSPEWKQLSATPEMTELANSVKKLGSQLEQMSQETPQAQSERAHLLQEIKQQEALYTVLDVVRRINFGPAPSEERPGMFDRVGRVFVSRGMLSDLRGTGKLLSHVSRVALCLSLVSLSAGSIGEGLVLRQAEVESVKVSLSLKEARQAHSSEQPNTAALSTEQVQKAIAYTASRFEAAVLSHPVWNHSANLIPKSNYESRADYVRISVEEQLYPNQKTPTSLKNDLKATDWKINPESAAGFVESLPDEGPRTSLGKAYERYLSKTTTVSEKARIVQIFQKHLTTYNETADYIDLQRWTVGEAVGSLLDLVTPETENEISKQLLASLSEFSQDFVKKSYDVMSQQYLTSLLEDDSYEAASLSTQSEMSRLHGMPIAAKEMQSTLENLANSDGAIRGSLKKAAVDQFDLSSQPRTPEVTDLTQRMIGREKQLLADRPGAIASAEEAIKDSLHTFADEFPLPEAVQGQEELARADRAVKFEEVVKDRHTGGIVIGRLPEPNSMADARNLSWALSIQRDTFSLSITDARNQTTTLGPFPAGLAKQALLYASDPRPLAVTVLNAPMIARRQIMIHPALRNTPLGCRFLEADHFIFNTLTPKGTTTEVSQAVDRIQIQAALYNSAIDRINGAAADQVEQPTELQLGALAPLGSTASPLTSLPSVFDQRVVKALTTCSLQRRGDFMGCVATESQSAGSKLARQGTQVASQIQELTFIATPDLSFVGHSPSPTEAWPLRMTIHMSVNDQAVWELQGLTSDVQVQFLDKVSPEQRSQLTEMQQFTILQRLFRTAYAGALGSSFPIERLAQLASALKNITTSSVNTPVWSIEGIPRDMNEKAIEQLAESVKRDVTSAKLGETERDEIRKSMQDCIDLIQKTNTPDLIPDPDLRASCRFSDVLRPDSQIELYAEQLFDGRKLRQSLGATQVDEQLSCAPVDSY